METQMILVTGGLGFIGLHTARALLDLGESCVLTRYRANRQPSFLADEIGERVFIEQVDVADAQAVLDVGSRHEITGIVHLAERGLGVPTLAGDGPRNAAPLMNVLRAAREWGVRRVSIASAIGVYMNAGHSPLREDLPLPMTASHPLELMKKTAELLSGFVATDAKFEVVILRIGGVYGPLYHNMTNWGVAARLVHPALKGEPPEFTPEFQPHAEDGIDWCYVKDCGRAIALLQTATALRHRVYNVGTGHPTTNGDFAAAVNKAIPDAKIELPAGRDPHGSGQDFYLDVGRIRADTGFEPAYDVDRGIADYVDWLRAGNSQ
ncbi:MAG TPA: NAD(P)-dependent oxidoreductase [Pseudonocardiaceae bacterium]|jgi:UDP-glucose 4-epimerase|nr:NAD(P)-dependent oxidoreductase [Pseudonocardiaceae bacterium]